VRVHGPGNIGFLGSVTAIMGGEHHNFALKSDGTVWAWGGNFVGQLGTGSFTNTDVPVQVSFPVSVTMLGGRGYHSLAVDMNGTVWAWGWNTQGQLGHDTTGNPCGPGFTNTTCSNVPIPVLGISHPLTVTGGGFFSLAVMPDHTVMGWGSNTRGQLGDGSFTNQPLPVAASSVLSHVVQLSAGWKHAVALTEDGHVWAWGDNLEGEIGLGITTTQGISVPTQVPGLSGVVSVSAGDRFTGALKGDGTVWTWGANQFLQLGNDSNVAYSAVPVQVIGLDHVNIYAARDYHDLAVKEDQTVWAWGSGQNGELGDNLTSDSNVPVQVIFAPEAPPILFWLPLILR
jgi:alpha-tubulin suppressor-like RCC1 family protein